MVFHWLIAVALAVLGVQGGPCWPNSGVSSLAATTSATGISSDIAATKDNTWLPTLSTTTDITTDSTALDLSSPSHVDSTTTAVSDADSDVSATSQSTTTSESIPSAIATSEPTTTISTRDATSTAPESISSATISTSSMTITEAPVETNLVRNPSFEDDNFAPWSAITGEVRTADRLGVAQDKYKYFVLPMNFGSTRDIRQAELQGTEAGVSYKLTFYIAWGNIRSSSQWSSCTIAIVTGYGVQRHTIKPRPLGDYELIEEVFAPRTAPSGLLLRHSCDITTDADLWLDNISVVKIA